MKAMRIWGIGGGALALLVAGIGWAPQDTGQKVGSKVDRAVEEVKQGARNAAGAVREGFAKVRTGVHDMGVESRVYSRLHWDKSLNAATIDIEVHKDGVATLRGSVPDAATKVKAVHLAMDTVGVTRVVDELAVAPATPSGTTTTTTTIKTQTKER